MKITDIKPVKRNKSRSSVFLDGNFAFSLANSVIADTGIKKGDTLSREELNKIVKRREFQKAVDYALLLLSYRPRSVSELYRKMEEKGYETDIIDKVAGDLKSEGVLGDKSFALWWIAQRREGRPKGDIAIKSELKSKGVKEGVIEEALLEANRSRTEDELDLAWKACKSRLDGYRRLPEDKAARRLSSLLRRRGFNFEVINKVLDKFLEGKLNYEK
ncbi:MAG: RecX family transcriptional regulator [Elusimicrobiota bacterium]|nr:RecX family transcriptional regulator [Elusimicrobiota bacterium]